MYNYICICHSLIVWACFLWCRPQTTSHVVLVWPESDWRVKKIVRQLKWSRSNPSMIILESENGNKGTLHQKSDNGSTTACSFAFGDSHDTSLTSWNSSDDDFAIFTAVPRPQHLAPAHYTLLQWKSTCIFPDVLLARHTLHIRIPSLNVV